MSHSRWIAPVVSRCAGVFLVGLSSGCIRESLADSPPLRLPASAAMLNQVQRPTPADFRSKWDAANWQTREAAFTRAGLVEVELRRLPTQEAPKDEAPAGSCQALDGTRHGLLFSRGELFGVARDGTLHCVKLDMPSRGDKSVRLGGFGNCSGGANPGEPTTWSSYFEIPDGIKVGSLKTLSAPQYHVGYTFREPCPPFPRARQ